MSKIFFVGGGARLFLFIKA